MRDVKRINVGNAVIVIHHRGLIDEIPVDKAIPWFTAINNADEKSVEIYFRKDNENNIFLQDSSGKDFSKLSSIGNIHVSSMVELQEFNCDSGHPFHARRLWIHGGPQCNPTISCGGCKQVSPIPFVTLYSCMHDFCCVSPVDLITNAAPQNYPG